VEFNEFVSINLEEWRNYFFRIYDEINSGRLRLGAGMLLYPNIALFTETDEHFIFELFGATRIFNGLEEKIHKESSTSRYLGQFGSELEEPMFNLGGRNNGFIWLLFSREADYKALRKRFVFSDMWKSRLDRKGGRGSLLNFTPDFTSCFFDYCLLVNRYEEIYRVKHILHIRIVSKSHSKEDYYADLLNAFKRPWMSTHDVYGVHYIPSKFDESYVLAGQFANIFLLPGLRETTIGKFLESNPIYIRRALKCKSFLYEEEFDWIEGNPDPTEKSIQPDLLLEKESGFYDICDLKTAALDKIRITKGGHRRRRFIDYVEEGIAQLANYQDYFNFEKNAKHAESEHGVKVDNPDLYLVVGSYENSTKDEIEEASRRLKPNYYVIDYDTLNALFLQSYYPDVKQEKSLETRADNFYIGDNVVFYYNNRKYKGKIINLTRSGVQIQYISQKNKKRRKWKSISDVKKIN
jgi:hypothetical protein